MIFCLLEMKIEIESVKKDLFRYDVSSTVNSSFSEEERPINNSHVPLVQAFMMLDNYFLFLPAAVII